MLNAIRLTERGSIRLAFNQLLTGKSIMIRPSPGRRNKGSCFSAVSRSSVETMCKVCLRLLSIAQSFIALATNQQPLVQVGNPSSWSFSAFCKCFRQSCTHHNIIKACKQKVFPTILYASMTLFHVYNSLLNEY